MVGISLLELRMIALLHSVVELTQQSPPPTVKVELHL
jgi:hypothetical protein